MQLHPSRLVRQSVGERSFVQQLPRECLPLRGRELKLISTSVDQANDRKTALGQPSGALILLTGKALGMAKILKLIKENSGATAIEYGLIAALISVAAIGALSAVGNNLSGTFNNISVNLNK